MGSGFAVRVEDRVYEVSAHRNARVSLFGWYQTSPHSRRHRACALVDAEAVTRAKFLPVQERARGALILRISQYWVS